MNYSLFMLGLPSAVLLSALACSVQAQSDWPQTRAEQTDYRETSHYADVTAFLERLQAKSGRVQVQYIGTSAGGRRIPLAIVSQPPVATQIEARRSGKLVVYIQANIHAGEVEGKEAALMFLRQLAQEQSGKKSLLDKMVFLVTPIYNIDGNEKFGDGRRNRGSQDGPDLVGERANGQGLDLNRDCIKAESPEMRAVLQSVYNAWDPDVMMDLHTTNGTRHGYQLTYSPALNPNTEAGILRYTRDELLPTVRKRLLAEHGERLFDYGNAERRGNERAWATFGEEGRYVTNYAGLRNRVAVLSEAASFLPFKTRVVSTLRFVNTILEETAKNATRVLKLTRDADTQVVGWGQNPQSAPALGVRFEMAPHGTESIPLEKLTPGQTVDHRKAPQALENVTLPVYDRFKATRTAAFPAAYLVPENQGAAVELLRRHGIVVERLVAEWQGEAQSFEVMEQHADTMAFQGHRLVRLEGRFLLTKVTMPAGGYLVRTAQPLGILAFHLLEPEGLDGLSAWGFLGGLKPDDRYPVLKLMTPPTVATERP